ncbi:MAG: DUF5686 and carboxypeptidase regulatory-like domain-containing protein, partial [Cyclobacteriaceae bacterium]|nr:DUF5686 and carboxypeptidase regulatory-like domain-containing protein [Cyclobacteriaceae bacterium]
MAGKLYSRVYWVIVLIFVIFFTREAYSQGMVIKGKVTDANSGSAIPFVNVYFKNTQTGVTTDFDGYYTIKRIPGGDSLVVSYVGYLPKTKAIPDGPEVTIDFQLEEDVITLQEIVFTAEENPAFKILKNIRKNKAVNDKRSLEAYEYESYTKIEFDVDNITEKFKNRRIIQKISAVMDSIEQIAGEDGNPILPVFMSEAISRFYYRDNPVMKHEEILKTKISALGITDGTTTSQFVGSSFQQYNFYENWLTILGKEFVSPIADSWRGLYDYYLTDSLYLGEDYCYRIEFSPKSEQDLAFLGTMWITKNEWAIRQIDVAVDKSTNLNFIEKIRIQQELQKTTAGPWIPLKTRVIIDLNELTKNTAGILAKFYVSNKNIVVNKPKPNSFYELPILMSEDIREDDGNFWSQYRHDSLTSTEENLYVMIDTMKKIPFVKTTS